VPQHGREVVSGQFEVLWIGAVTVENGGNLAVSPRPPGRAFAGLGSHSDLELVAC
jgi:hypothetical protein